MIKLKYIEDASLVEGTVYELDNIHPLMLEKRLSKIKEDGFIMGNITVPILMELYRANIELILPTLRNYISGLETETNLILIGSTDLDKYTNVTRVKPLDVPYSYSAGRSCPAAQVVGELNSRLDGVSFITGATMAEIELLRERLIEIRNGSIYTKFLQKIPSLDIANEYNLSPARVSQIVRATINNKW